MKNLWLKSKFKVLEKYKGKSKFLFWSNLEVGDIIEISTKMESGHYAHTFFANRLTVKPCPVCDDEERIFTDQWEKCNCEQFVKFSCGATHMGKYLTQLDLQEI